MRDRRAGRPTVVVFCIVLAGCGGGSAGGNGDDGGSVPPPPPPPPPPTGLPTTTTSSQTAFVKTTANGWQVVPLLTVGDAPEGSAYMLVGKPDGLGAVAGRLTDTGEFVDRDAYLTVFMNHELPGDRGAMHSHGTRGAFVSQWTIELDTLRTTAGRDLTTDVFTFGNGAWADTTGTVNFDRLCSADLPPAGTFNDAASGTGYDGRLFLNGEETPEGRAFAYVGGGPDHGTVYELPHVGKYSHENVLTHHASGTTTLAISTDDDAPGQVYVYVGTKRASGNPVERAGLHGGKLYGVRVIDGGANYAGGAVKRENKGAIQGRFDLVDVSDAAPGTGAELQATSVARGITEFARPEDGAWDTRNGQTFYFATTGQNIDGNIEDARLYRLVFDSVTSPTGGTIEPALDGSTVMGSDGAAGRGFDNVTVDGAGRVVVQEDGRDADPVAKVWIYDPANGSVTQVLEADRDRFMTGGAGFLTNAEEHSGVIEITDEVRGAAWFEPGRRYYLGTLQAHYPRSEALFEDGQLYLFASP